MRKNSDTEVCRTAGVAFFWDESFLWGLMAYKALCASGLPFDLLRSEDIRKGKLRDYSMLFVPGGWASNKLKALGDEGAAGIRGFVEAGGNYLGFCGGAGLATLDGIGLLRVKRKPTKQRVPSFSGRIRLNLSDHSIWEGVPGAGLKRQTSGPPDVFHAWWPSQLLADESSVNVLATYGEALADSFSSDLNVGDTAANGDWTELERIYGINLNPKRMLGDPAIVEGLFGRGRVVLSLIHFDTPSDDNGPAVLRSLWKYLSGTTAVNSECQCDQVHPGSGPVVSEGEAAKEASRLEAEVADLILLGTRNFLWFWRNPMLMQWRRGVRGLEYCTLYVMIKEIAEIIRSGKYHSFSSGDRNGRLREGLSSVGALLAPFIEGSKRLLVLERLAMQNGHITYERCEDPEVSKIRKELFSDSKSHGGLFKRLIDEIDKVLFMAIDRPDV